jgi:hypothetical protein
MQYLAVRTIPVREMADRQYLAVRIIPVRSDSSERRSKRQTVKRPVERSTAYEEESKQTKNL